MDLNWNISERFLENEDLYKDGVDEVIKLLKKLNFTLVLATSATRNQVDIYSRKNKKMLDKLNLYDYFDLILTKEDVDKKKPDPEIYFKVLETLNAKCSECIVFEDSLHGVMSANGANIEVINIYDRYSDKDR